MSVSDKRAHELATIEPPKSIERIERFLSDLTLRSSAVAIFADRDDRPIGVAGAEALASSARMTAGNQIATPVTSMVDWLYDMMRPYQIGPLELRDFTLWLVKWNDKRSEVETIQEPGPFMPPPLTLFGLPRQGEADAPAPITTGGRRVAAAAWGLAPGALAAGLPAQAELPGPGVGFGPELMHTGIEMPLHPPRPLPTGLPDEDGADWFAPDSPERRLPPRDPDLISRSWKGGREPARPEPPRGEAPAAPITSQVDDVAASVQPRAMAPTIRRGLWMTNLSLGSSAAGFMLGRGGAAASFAAEQALPGGPAWLSQQGPAAGPSPEFGFPVSRPPMPSASWYGTAPPQPSTDALQMLPGPRTGQVPPYSWPVDRTRPPELGYAPASQQMPGPSAIGRFEPGRIIRTPVQGRFDPETPATPDLEADRQPRPIVSGRRSAWPGAVAVAGIAFALSQSQSAGASLGPPPDSGPIAGGARQALSLILGGGWISMAGRGPQIGGPGLPGLPGSPGLPGLPGSGPMGDLARRGGGYVLGGAGVDGRLPGIPAMGGFGLPMPQGPASLPFGDDVRRAGGLILGGPSGLLAGGWPTMSLTGSGHPGLPALPGRPAPRPIVTPEMGQITIVAPPLRVASPDAERQGAAVAFDLPTLARGAGALDAGGLARLTSALPAGAQAVYPALPRGSAGASGVNLRLAPSLLHSLLERSYGGAAAGLAREATSAAAASVGTPASMPLSGRIVPTSRPAGAVGGMLGDTSTAAGALGEAGGGQAQRGRTLGFLGLPVRLAPSLGSKTELGDELALRGAASETPGAALVRPQLFAPLRDRLFPSFQSVIAEPDHQEWRRAAPSFGLKDARPTTLLAPDARAELPTATSSLPQMGAVGRNPLSAGALGSAGLPVLPGRPMSFPPPTPGAFTPRLAADIAGRANDIAGMIRQPLPVSPFSPGLPPSLGAPAALPTTSMGATMPGLGGVTRTPTPAGPVPVPYPTLPMSTPGLAMPAPQGPLPGLSSAIPASGPTGPMPRFSGRRPGPGAPQINVIEPRISLPALPGAPGGRASGGASQSFPGFTRPGPGLPSVPTPGSVAPSVFGTIRPPALPAFPGAPSAPARPTHPMPPAMPPLSGRILGNLGANGSFSEPIPSEPPARFSGHQPRPQTGQMPVRHFPSQPMPSAPMTRVVAGPMGLAPFLQPVPIIATVPQPVPMPMGGPPEAPGAGAMLLPGMARGGRSSAPAPSSTSSPASRGPEMLFPAAGGAAGPGHSVMSLQRAQSSAPGGGEARPTAAAESQRTGVVAAQETSRAAVEVHLLANEVWSVLKHRIRVERERRGPW